MGNAVDGRSDARGFSAFLARHLPLFSINFLGLVAVRIWIQADLYDRYTSTDSGIITIAANLLRAVLILVMLAIIARRGFSPKAQNALSLVSAAAMTTASALFLLESVYPSQTLVASACALAGFGIIWGGGMWMCFYVRLRPAEALLYAFLSLAASSFLGLFLGIVPENVALLVAILMPTLSCIAFKRAQALLDAREDREAPGGREDAARRPEPLYDREPRSTFVRLLAGVALFNLALGIARGFPSGASIELPLLFQALHQVGAVALSLGVIGWALVAGRTLKFSSLWNVAVTLVVAGVLTLASMSEPLAPFGAMLIAAANTFSLGLLWYSCYDIARHSSWAPYAILGLGWVAHILPRELGRALIWVVEPHSAAAVGITTVIVLLLAVSMALLLGDSIPRTRPLFADFRTRGGSIASSIAAHAQAALAGGGEAADTDAAGDTLTRQLEQLKRRYFLTEREHEVVALLARGRSKTAIGEKLFLSENTVKTYVKNVYAKLDVHTKQELLDRIDEQPVG